MATYQVETAVGHGSDEEVEADSFTLTDGHFIFYQDGSYGDRPVFAIPATYVRTIREAKS